MNRRLGSKSSSTWCATRRSSGRGSRYRAGCTFTIVGLVLIFVFRGQRSKLAGASTSDCSVGNFVEVQLEAVVLIIVLDLHTQSEQT